MWVFTTKGFLSIVQHKDMADHFQVKSRVRAPLESLWPDHDVLVIDWADYRFRINIRKDEAIPVHQLKAICGMCRCNFRQVHIFEKLKT